MGESVEILKTKLKDCRIENGRLHKEKMILMKNATELQNQIFSQPERANRENDQPLPVKNDYPCIQDLVIKDMEHRKEIGLKRYGTTLQPFNGRNSLRDAYEEAIDLAVYLRQLIFEQENGKTP